MIKNSRSSPLVDHQIRWFFTSQGVIARPWRSVRALLSWPDVNRILALLVLPACISYGTNAEHPTAKDYAELAVAEVASAAILGAMHDDTPGSRLNDQPYLQRSGEILGGLVLVDAIMALDLSIRGDGDH
jgi:hypothetical protein